MNSPNLTTKHFHAANQKRAIQFLTLHARDRDYEMRRH